MTDKKVVLAFGLSGIKIDPQFCTHENALHIIEIDGERWECPDCGATLDEDWEIIRVVSDELEF